MLVLSEVERKDFPRNHYEGAFENWLIDNNVQYIAIDDRKKAAFAGCKVKSFDFLLYPRSGQIIIAEVKGRKFKGASFAKLAGLECWVTLEDVNDLARWQEIFGPGHQAIFVFGYSVENIDVDFDGRPAYEFDESRFVFFCLTVDDYRSFMKRRSPKWQTVTLPADKFRQCVLEINEFLP